MPLSPNSLLRNWVAVPEVAVRAILTRLFMNLSILTNYVQQNGNQSTFLRTDAHIRPRCEDDEMSTAPSALSQITAAPPSLHSGLIAREVGTQYDLSGTYTPLISERDQNFCMTTAGGERFVVKIVSAV